MALSSLRRSFALLLLLAIQGCQPSQPPIVVTPGEPEPEPAREMPQNLPSEAAAAVEIPHPQACALVTQEEMSKILGTKMLAEGGGGDTKTACLYKAAKGKGPSVEFSVNWGSGQGGMNMARMLSAAKPEMTTAYPGIGDQATMVGTSLMIRTGEDLVILVMSDVADTAAKAKRIFDTAKARM